MDKNFTGGYLKIYPGGGDALAGMMIQAFEFYRETTHLRTIGIASY